MEFSDTALNSRWSCVCHLFATQLGPTSQIVICFLFAQPLVCKLLSVNQATNYTAAAAEWHLVLRASSDVKKKHMKHSVVSFLLLLWNILFPQWLTRQTENRKRRLPVPIGQSETCVQRKYQVFLWNYSGHLAAAEWTEGWLKVHAAWSTWQHLLTWSWCGW